MCAQWGQHNGVLTHQAILSLHVTPITDRRGVGTESFIVGAPLHALSRLDASTQYDQGPAVWRALRALWGAGKGQTSEERSPEGRESSRPMFSMSRSRSSRFVNSRVMRPFRLPTSMRTGASRRLERRLVRSTTRGS